MANDLVSVTIDGEEVKVKKGTPVLEAAEQAGIYIPHLCYLHGLPAFVGCRKPDPRIYNLTLERVGLDPEECIFIDDMKIRFIPEVRYTRWMGRTFDTLSTQSRVDQIEGTISITF